MTNLKRGRNLLLLHSPGPEYYSKLLGFGKKEPESPIKKFRTWVAAGFNLRSVRCDTNHCRVRLRQAKRVFDGADGAVDAATLSTIEEPDLRASRVFSGGLDRDQNVSI